MLLLGRRPSSAGMVYLRVKNWRKHQHYRDRRPPWIKLWAGLMSEDDGFADLDEQTQWQLVRVWLLASKSSRFTSDEKGEPVPVVTSDEATLRRQIRTLRKIPLNRIVDAGFLVPVDAGDVFAMSTNSKDVRDAVTAQFARPTLAPGLHDASTGASTTLALLLEVEKGRDLEKGKDLKTLTSPSSLVRSQPLLEAGTDSSAIGKLRRACRVTEGSADDGKLQRAAHRLPESVIADLAFSAPADVRDRFGWTLAQLKRARDERKRSAA